MHELQEDHVWKHDALIIRHASADIRQHLFHHNRICVVLDWEHPFFSPSMTGGQIWTKESAQAPETNMLYN